MDTWAKYKKCDDLRVAAPKSVADAIEIKSIAENGIFEVGKGGVFTKTYAFSDINYATASVDEQAELLESWAKWLNSNNEQFKITFSNKNRDMQQFRNDILFNHKMDMFDELRDSFNDIIEERIIDSRQGIEQELFITIRTDNVSSYEDAKNYFKDLENSMDRAFKDIGSRLTPLNATERLRVLHNIYRFGNEGEFHFDFSEAVERGWDFKETIEPARMDFTLSDHYFQVDNNYCSAVYIRTLPFGGELSDRFLTNLFALNIKMMCSIDTYPIRRDDVDKRLKKLYLGVQKSIRKQNKKRIKEKDFSSEISIDTQYAEADIKGIIDDVRNKNQHLFWTSIVILVINSSVDGLRKDIDQLVRAANGSSVSIEYAFSQQKEALNTVLPIGVKQVDFGIPLETRSLCSMFPFNVQELMVAGGNWYGSNKVSKNLCIGNRKKLMNPHGLVFGVTGSGKTGCVSLEMMQNFLKTYDDDIIFIDPKNSIFDLVNDLQGAIVDISTTSDTYVNPLEYYGDESRINIADEKAEVVLSILEACKKAPLDARESSIANRCLKYIYKDSLLGTGVNQPTMKDLYDEFDKLSKEGEGLEASIATDLKLYLELFVKGSLNIFSKPTNIDVENRLICFGLGGIGQGLWDLGILVMLEHVTERIRKNYANNRATWIYIDEIGTLFQHETSQKYILSLWKKVRSMGGICTGIMQNVSEILQNNTTQEILENSEFVMILKQHTVADSNLVEALGISYEQVKYITSEAGSGRGLLKCGPTIVPIDMVIPENSDLFRYVDTDAHKRFERAKANK